MDGTLCLICSCTRAIILLHEPYARLDLGIGSCSSTYKIHEASRAILELIYSVRAGTSFDITLLEPSAVVRVGNSAHFRTTLMGFSLWQFYWYTAGRVLLKFWAVAKRAMSSDEALTLRAEVEYIA